MDFQQLTNHYHQQDLSLCFSKDIHTDQDILPTEHRLLNDIKNNNRRKELINGRWCAHQALNQFGVGKRFPILQGEFEQPLWPEGFIGSIAHCDDLYCAVVASTDLYLSVGIDCENVHRIIKEPVWDLVLNEDEKYWIRSYSTPFIRKIIFSVKESFYKMMFPLVKWKFYFDIVSVQQPCNEIDLVLVLNRDLSQIYRKGQKFQAKVHQTKDYILTLMWLERE